MIRVKLPNRFRSFHGSSNIKMIPEDTHPKLPGRKMDREKLNTRAKGNGLTLKILVIQVCIGPSSSR